jgi:L-cysteine/cystine lyase
VEHSSGIVPAYYLRERRGAELEIVPVAAQDAPDAIAERFAAALSRPARLVILSEISYSTGQLLPLAEIVEAAHGAGACVVVDGAQTAGHIPIDVRASGVDCYAIPSHKWLCGPDGLGMLYVRRDLIPQIEPPKVAGRAAVSYDFEGHFEPEREKVTKYELTTVSGALIAGTVVAIEQYLESSPAAVFDRARELYRHARRRFEGIDGVTVTSPHLEQAQTGLFCFHVEGEEAARVSAYLQREARVVCRAVREYDSVRLSLNAFNTEAEIDRAAEAVERALVEGIPEEIAAGAGAETRPAAQA